MKPVRSARLRTPAAIVMNMFYTGLGIARSLGERGIRVIGLSAHAESYGRFTRYATVYQCPDSREQPEALLAFLLRLADGEAGGGIIFPTRDDDLLFLERFRDPLREFFVLALPGSSALKACLDKWETYRWAQMAGVPAPRCWMADGKEDLLRIAPQLPFPCVLKPVFAHLWRKRRNWETVGGRKVIAVFSPAELFGEYERIAHAESRVLIQEMVGGTDECLYVAACYLDRESRLVAGFTAQKLFQVPEGFGTGCIVQTVDRPDLLATAARLLEKMQFTGIAEVEFKWEAASGQHKLIEINPRPWDQHRLGNACGIDLIHIAYCDAMGMARPAVPKQRTGAKWIAEDVLCLALLRRLRRRHKTAGSLLRLAGGERIYAIWSARDPMPSLAFLCTRFVPGLVRLLIRSLLGRFSPKRISQNRGSCYEHRLEKTKYTT